MCQQFDGKMEENKKEMFFILKFNILPSFVFITIWYFVLY